jgi:CheY-like chemotaxis protein
VTDNGEGVKKEKRNKIFKLFAAANDQDEQQVKGIGLGLAISKLIVN